MARSTVPKPTDPHDTTVIATYDAVTEVRHIPKTTGIISNKMSGGGATLQTAGVTVINPGTGYAAGVKATSSLTPIVTVPARSPLTGSSATVTITVSGNAIQNATITVGGSGYYYGDILSVAGGTGGTVMVTHVTNSDAINKLSWRDWTTQYKTAYIQASGNGVSILNAGTGYSDGLATTTPFSGSMVGSGAILSLNTLTGNISEVGIVNQGSGYTVGDVLSVSGGTGGKVTILHVAADGGVNAWHPWPLTDPPVSYPALPFDITGLYIDGA